MNFAALEYLYLLWILPAMVLLAVYSFRKKDQLLRLFAELVEFPPRHTAQAGQHDAADHPALSQRVGDVQRQRLGLHGDREPGEVALEHGP